MAVLPSGPCIPGHPMMRHWRSGRFVESGAIIPLSCYRRLWRSCSYPEANTSTDRRKYATTPVNCGTVGRKSWLFSNLQLQRLVPLDTFSDSVYSVPVLLALRLFYQARSWTPSLPTMSFPKFRGLGQSTATQLPIQTTHELFKSPQKLNTSSFRCLVQQDDALAHGHVVKSMTWVKALASPLSHEFVQIIVEDVKSASRYRLVVDRTDAGDIVVAGWQWSSGKHASYHQALPLPLLSLSFHSNLDDRPPTLVEVSRILVDVSQHKPYNLMREMCWWYSEKVFLETKNRFGGAVVEWPAAKLRYSFVVRTKWMGRKALVRQAEAFEKLTSEHLEF